MGLGAGGHAVGDRGGCGIPGRRREGRSRSPRGLRLRRQASRSPELHAVLLRVRESAQPAPEQL